VTLQGQFEIITKWFQESW